MTDQLNKPTNPQPQAPDYGEPWKVGVYYCDIATRDFNPVAEVGWKKYEYRDRIIACVNACAGIPNETLTKEYIQEAIASLNTIKKINASDCERCGAKQPFMMQCKECGSSVGCGVSGEDFDNE